jgi:hypothetical protein
MSSILRLLLGLGLSSFVLALAGRLIAPCLLGELGLDWWNLTEQYREHAAEQERGEALAQKDRMLMQRVKEKAILTKQVIEGQLSLLEAAARFESINNAFAASVSDYRYWPGTSEGEKLCRQVIAWVASDLANRNRLDDPLVARLQAELADHLKQHGTVVLAHP